MHARTCTHTMHSLSLPFYSFFLVVGGGAGGGVVVRLGQIKIEMVHLPNFSCVCWYMLILTGNYRLTCTLPECILCYLQVSQEPGNTEALEKSQLIEPLQQHIEQAKGLYKRGDYQGVINTLGPVLEVSAPTTVELEGSRLSITQAASAYQNIIVLHMKSTESSLHVWPHKLKHCSRAKGWWVLNFHHLLLHTPRFGVQALPNLGLALYFVWWDLDWASGLLDKDEKQKRKMSDPCASGCVCERFLGSWKWKKSKRHFRSLKPSLNQKIYIFEMLHFSTV